MKGLARLVLRLAPLLGLRLGATARVFGAEVFGFFSFAQTTVVMAAPVATFGFDKLLMRRLASVSRPLIATDPGWGPVLRFCLRLSTALALGLSGLGLALFWGAGLGGIYMAAMILGAAAAAISGAPRDGGAIAMIYVTAMTLSAAAALLLLRPIVPRLRGAPGWPRPWPCSAPNAPPGFR